MQDNEVCRAASRVGLNFKYALIAGTISLLLTGCFEEKVPSDKTIQRELEKLYVSSCALYSIKKIERGNGFPQQDGSYVVQLKFSIDYIPDAKVRLIVQKFDADLVALGTEPLRLDPEAEIVLMKHLKDECRGSLAAESLPTRIRFGGMSTRGPLSMINGMRVAYRENYDGDIAFIKSDKGWVLKAQPKPALTGREMLPEHHVAKKSPEK